VVSVGNWSVTGGQLKGGTNLPSAGYGFAYLTNSATNYVVSGQVAFPAGSFGGGIGGRWDTNTGAHYAAWLYPDSSPGGADQLKILRFAGASNAAPFSVLGTAALGLQGTNFHAVKLAFLGSRIAAYLDGTLLLSVTDATLPSGLLASVDMWTDTAPYVMGVDDVTAKLLAIDDAFNVNGGTTTTVPAPGILANDTGVNGTNLTAALATGPTHGILGLNADGSFNYTPTNGYSGTDTFTYQPSDSTAILGTATVTITVKTVNNAPTLGTQTNRTIVELTTLTVTNAGSDAETAPGSLVYTLTVTNASGVVANATISGAGVISWTPTEAQGPSTNTFITVLSDDGTPPLSATNSFVVVVTETNTAPVFTLTPADRTVNELAVMTVTNKATDADLPANTLTYTLSVTNGLGVAVGNAAVSAAGVITWTPNEAQGPSTNIFTTRVTDNGSPALSATNTFTVVVNEVNNAPTLPAQGNRTILPLSSITVTNTATDTNVPAATLTYTLTVTNAAGAVANAAISANGIITWTPGSDQDQTTNVFTTIVSNFNAIAVNAQRLSATNNFTVVVNSRAVVVTNSASLVAETCAPANNAIDPGENVTVVFSFKDIGLGNTTNLVVTLLETGGVSSPSGPLTYGALTAGGSAVSQPFTFTAGSTCGSTIVATFQLQDGSLNLGTNTVPFILGQVGAILTQNFDTTAVPALPAGWTTSFGGAGAAWRSTNSLANSGTNAMFSADASNVSSNELVSPAITLPLGPNQLTFKHRFDLEYDTTTGVGYDGGVLEIKIGAGAFSDILTAGGSFVSGGYNRTISTLYSNAFSGRQAWSGVINSYTNTIVNLPASAAGQTVQLRWRVGTDNGGTSGAGWRLDTIVLTGQVCCANSAPLLANQTNRTIAELTTLLVTNTATDPDQLTYTLTVSNATGVVNNASISSNGVITWTPTEAQGPSTNTFTTVVTDNGSPPLSSTNSFLVFVTEVNSAPVLPAAANYTIGELTTLTVTNTATDADIPANTLSYTLSVSSAAGPVNNANISANGIITWTPTEAQGPSTNTFTTVVTDDGSPNLSATNTFTVVVTEVNSAPAFTQTPANQTINELATLTVTNGATDSDLPANTLSYTLSVTSSAGPAANASISSLGIITWTPTEAQGPSTNTFITIVTDNGSPNLSATNTFIVVVNEVNSAPAFTQTPADQSMNELTTLTVTNAATDADLPANLLTYSLIVSNAAGAVTNATISGLGVIAWTPTEAQGPSTNTFTAIVTDNGSPVLSATNTFTVVVNEVNTAPVLPATTNWTISELTTLTVTNIATDTDIPANTLSYTLSVTSAAGPVANASISANGVITWTPTEAQGPSTNTFTTVVTDDGSPNLSTTNTFTVVVNEVNSAPAFTQTPANQTINELATLTVTNAATDADLPANTLSYTLSVTSAAGAVANASISASGVITWMPTEAQGPSTNSFTTIVTDNGSPNLSATNSFTVVVNEVNSAPAFLQTPANQTINELVTLTVTNAATDSDLPANTLSYTLSVISASGPVTNASISSAGVITWTPSHIQAPSTNTFVSVVTDNGSPNLSATNTFLVVVPASTAAPAPVIQSITVSAGIATITWTSATDHTYRLQYSDSLTPTNWNDVAPDVTATGSTTSMTNAVGNAAARFYRVMALP
jgi:VCBS repeat-containing protein